MWKSCGDRRNKIEQNPLAFCASDSLDLLRDIATFEIQYPQRVGENWYGRASENVKGGDCKQRWSYWSDMTFEEVHDNMLNRYYVKMQLIPDTHFLGTPIQTMGQLG